MRVQRETSRPQGQSVSYTQLSQVCGGRLKFHRQRVKLKDVGIFLLYGRALHAGLEARAKGRARSDAEAMEYALRALHQAISLSQLPVSWDEPWRTNQDGGISADSYGNLCSQEAAEWWLGRQVALYLDRYPDQQVVRSEHHIFVPLTAPSGVMWRHPWSLECWLDREMRDESIHDIKSTAKPWDESDVRKYRVQALVYMAAYYHEYKRRPAYFEFQVLPRVRSGAQGAYEARPEIQTFRIEWDQKAIQAYLDSVVKPQITVIEADAFVFAPGNKLCSSRWCGYWDWCSFGAGEHA
jgi:hypothetical protein